MWTLLAGYVGTELPWFWSNLHASADRMAQKISENMYNKSQHGNLWGAGKTPLVRKKHFQLSKWNISTISINIHQSELDFGGFLNLQWRWVIASSDLPVKHDGPWGQSSNQVNYQTIATIQFLYLTCLLHGNYRTAHINKILYIYSIMNI